MNIDWSATVSAFVALASFIIAGLSWWNGRKQRGETLELTQKQSDFVTLEMFKLRNDEQAARIESLKEEIKDYKERLEEYQKTIYRLSAQVEEWERKYAALELEYRALKKRVDNNI